LSIVKIAVRWFPYGCQGCNSLSAHKRYCCSIGSLEPNDYGYRTCNPLLRQVTGYPPLGACLRFVTVQHPVRA
jgi:hypothetical protein